MRSVGEEAQMTIVIRNTTILDEQAPFGSREGVNIVIRGNLIDTVTAKDVNIPSNRQIDGSNLLVIPGLINAHTHSPENIAKGLNDRLPFEPWLAHSIWAMDGITPADYHMAALLGCIEMLQSGVTSVLDHVGIGGVDVHDQLNAVMQAYAVSGMRAGVAPLFREIPTDLIDGHSRGYLTDADVPVSATVEDTRRMTEVLEAFFKRWHQAEGDRLRCWVGPSGVQWFSIENLHLYFDLARRHRGGVHMHLMETRIQDQLVRRAHGKTAVEMLDAENLLGPDVSLPHSVWLTNKDVDRLARTGAVPVHNPAANLRLGSGLSPISRMLAAGVLPGLGADGAKSSDHQNMFGHIHLAALVHNLSSTNPSEWVSSRQVVRMATVGGAAALMRPKDLGAIAPGYLADLALLDLRSPGLVPLNDAYHHLAYCELGAAVRHVIIDGKIVVENKKVLSFDADAVIDQARAAATRRHFRKGVPAEIQARLDRILKYQQSVVNGPPFEQD
jgi:5-methylthioadenosine/S-adenosylhomocysteine deaminase